MKCKGKFALTFFFFAGLSLLYAYWPSADPMADYQLKRRAADPAQQQELRRILGTIRAYSEKNDFRTLERGFIHTPQERRISQEIDGCDPVTDGLATLRRHVADLQWEQSEMFTFEQNSKRVEVVLPLREQADGLRLTFRHQGRSYYLVAIER